MKTYLNFTFKAKAYTLSVCLLLLSVACKKEQTDEQIKQALNSNTEKLYKGYLKTAYQYLDSIDLDKDKEINQNFFIKSRKYFKKSEPILSYAEKENYKSLNAPNLIRIQEEDPTDIKINQPIGYQVIEENLFNDSLDTIVVKRAINITSGRLKLINNNTHIKLKDYHMLWLLKDAIVRLATVGLSNFDSPVLGQSLKESSYTLQTLKELLTIYKTEFQNPELYNNWVEEIDRSIKFLDTDFDTFDRFEFIKTHTKNQISLWNKTVNDWGTEFPFEMALSNDFELLFSEKLFNVSYFADYKSDTVYLKQKVALGKQLFNDKNLSINNHMSCATCHDKNLAFTDGKKTFNQHQKRNTPTLTYAGLQQAFFLDNRAGSLEGQIVGVVTNHNEFDSNLDVLVKKVKTNKKYIKVFDSLYTKKVTDANIRHAIAAYVRSLNKFNSKFDNNINGRENTLSVTEKRGFNLFMGKAACATCHFPPLFNGTVPPNFTESEMEIIGVPKTNKNLNLDDDLGRYELFKTEQRKGMFKTPTLRNIVLTAPYMHNGVYNTLEEVMDFYNQGGGAGLGFDVPHQTLPFDNLNLSEEEIKDIIAFMKTLTDTPEEVY
ncbi:cytochrome c peroxidase [Wenyingzhuangia heitensis]|uniref:Cytochrome c peroxidase n=1 Tax=Wenyingzhuangia heitensis TaxID=1487859 RepID=A0ABX0UC11_9FLAO|nr:cytochrome c peroxidase [Wenyingzhuangia heitensis]NIJ45011.1 cytochrome c peroxidase [Wenyingzhuangia heitensis]